MKSPLVAFAGNIAPVAPAGTQSPDSPVSLCLDLTATTPPSTSQTAVVLRWVSQKWDLVGVLLLIGSSAAYGVFALMHLGL